MKTNVLNWAAAAAISLVLGLSWHLDGPSELDAISDVQADLIDARAQAVVAMRDAKRGQP